MGPLRTALDGVEQTAECSVVKEEMYGLRGGGRGRGTGTGQEDFRVNVLLHSPSPGFTRPGWSSRFIRSWPHKLVCVLALPSIALHAPWRGAREGNRRQKSETLSVCPGEAEHYLEGLLSYWIRQWFQPEWTFI